jgi:hypothetical protein
MALGSTRSVANSVGLMHSDCGSFKDGHTDGSAKALDVWGCFLFGLLVPFTSCWSL